MEGVVWNEFAGSDPELARHIEERLASRKICYLATVRPDNWPRLHPVGVNFRDGRMVVVMGPSSPKGHDLRRNGRYAIHGTVEDNQGGGGEVLLTGTARPTEATPADLERGFVAFELLIGEVLATRYDPKSSQPISTRWPARQNENLGPPRATAGPDG